MEDDSTEDQQFPYDERTDSFHTPWGTHLFCITIPISHGKLPIYTELRDSSRSLRYKRIVPPSGPEVPPPG